MLSTDSVVMISMMDDGDYLHMFIFLIELDYCEFLLSFAVLLSNRLSVEAEVH